MNVIVNLFSDKKGELNRFLSKFYNTNLEIENKLNWEKKFANPIELAEIVGTYIDNSEDYLISMWISLDKDIYIKVSDSNANNIIKYLYERYPY